MRYAFAGVLLSIVAMLIVPLPPAVLDVLLALNVLGSACVLLLSIGVSEPLEFAAFAPALLLATLFRLALDVSATRLILTQGNLVGGVGEIIPAFGAFVVRGNVIVGLVIFGILVTIQFVVVTHGAQRVAEVAARFTLDALPGKQMAIDAEVHAGAIDVETARLRRLAVQREADFFGSMEGAGKFVRGDAVASLVIVAVNVVGGLAVGVFYQHLSPGAAFSTYALLTVGNALLTTLPAFLISTAMGMLVTRVASDGDLGADLAGAILRHPEVLRAAAVLMAVLALVPALPRATFALLAAVCWSAATLAERRRAQRARAQELAREAERRRAMRRPEMALALVGVDAVAIDVGPGLLPLLDGELGEALLEKVGEVRRALAGDCGIVLPGVRLRDDLLLEEAAYAIRVRDEVVARGRLRLDALLAIGDPALLMRHPGERLVEPVYGLPALWIAPPLRDALLRGGALVFDPVSVLGSHLGAAAREHGAALLGRQEFATLVEHLRAGAPAVVKEVGGEALPLAAAHRVFVELLTERIWPRDPVAILEELAEAARAGADLETLVERARRVAVPPHLRGQARGEPLEAFVLDASDEAWFDRAADGVPEPGALIALRGRIESYVEGLRGRGGHPCVVCTALARPRLAAMLRRMGMRLPVYAFAELPPGLTLAAPAAAGADP
ncbi:MAG TPA: flagellar biosynthesis protein FlhA [Candidatus Dormibacteraeota bacterium]|nr:flagellar biosynthesis protein FlhA [Candidatus Dormibacteraeota bacterium]